MKTTIPTYELAIKFENEGYFLIAYPLFYECLCDNTFDKGDIYFHCGWCTEQAGEDYRDISVSFYFKAGEYADDSICRMNSYFRAGWILMHKKDFENAILSFKRAIEIGHKECEYGKLYYESLYWCAVCLEQKGRYFDAIELYKTTAELSTELNPECRYREIMCLTAVGLFESAAKVCRSFSTNPPKNFDLQRYNDLKALVQREQAMLKKSLHEPNNYRRCG